MDYDIPAVDIGLVRGILCPSVAQRSHDLLECAAPEYRVALMAHRRVASVAHAHPMGLVHVLWQGPGVETPVEVLESRAAPASGHELVVSPVKPPRIWYTTLVSNRSSAWIW